CLLGRRGVRPCREDERRQSRLCSLLAPRPFTRVGTVDTALAPVLSCLFPIASHVYENTLKGGVPARLGHAMVGLLRDPRDDQYFLGARHGHVEKTPMF